VTPSRPNAATQQSALDNGVSVCTTTDAGELVTVRAITSRSLNGSEPDYKTLDVGQATTADYTRDRLKFVYITEWRVANEYVQDNPAEGEPQPKAGIGTPRLWDSRVMEELLRMESESIIGAVRQNPPQSDWNDTAKRIMTVVDVYPLPTNHQIGVNVRQLNSAA
jgi:hypothetical protein